VLNTETNGLGISTRNTDGKNNTFNTKKTHNYQRLSIKMTRKIYLLKTFKGTFTVIQTVSNNDADRKKKWLFFTGCILNSLNKVVNMK